MAHSLPELFAPNLQIDSLPSETIRRHPAASRRLAPRLFKPKEPFTRRSQRLRSFRKMESNSPCGILASIGLHLNPLETISILRTRELVTKSFGLAASAGMAADGAFVRNRTCAGH